MEMSSWVDRLKPCDLDVCVSMSFVGIILSLNSFFVFTFICNTLGLSFSINLASIWQLISKKKAARIPSSPIPLHKITCPILIPAFLSSS